MKCADFLIAGAGINGLCLAMELSDAGATVVVLERGQCFSEASWAGGGIVSPLYPWRYAGPVTALAALAQERYPQLADMLLAKTGIDIELRRTGLLMLDAPDREDALAWARSQGNRIEMLDPAALYQVAPVLAPGFRDGLWMPQICNVRNTRLGKALLQLLRQRPGVRILEYAPVTEWRTSGRQVTGISSGAATRFVAGHYIVSAGAWTGIVLQQCGVDVPIRPVKGQMLLFETGQPVTSTILLHNGRYLIPRIGNQLLAGSTLEETGFDDAITEAAREGLLDFVRRLVPSLAGLEPTRQWSGLRPGSPQGIPFIGRLPAYDNLHVNAGQFRNGLVLAPASARLLADLLLGRHPQIDPAPYCPAY